MDKLKIILGASNTVQDGFVATDKDTIDLLDETSFSLYFNGLKADVFLAEHVWEHFSLDQALLACKNVYKYLKPGGYIRCAVPDKNFDNDWYQNLVQVGGPGPKNHPAYTHKIVYDYQTLTRIFEQVGFHVTLLEYCDEFHQFHYREWDPLDGKIGRSYRYDTRNSKETLKMVSLIIDAYKGIDSNDD